MDEELVTLHALVLCTQKEQEHLLAFEPECLDALVREKRALITQQEQLRTQREALVEEALPGVPADEATLGLLVEQVGVSHAAALTERRGRIRALLGALAELNEVARVYAHRHLRFVRECRTKLGGGYKTGVQTSYDSVGRPQRRTGGGMRLNGRV